MKEFFVGALCLCLSSGAAAPATVDGGKVRCENPFHYVGLTADQEKARIDHRFRIANRSSVPAEIESAERACGCTQASKRAYRFDFPALIEPGREGDIRVRYASAPISGVPDIREFSVRFRNHSLPPLNFTILSKRLSPVTIFPGEDVFVLCRSGEPISRNLYVVATDRKDLQLALQQPPDSGLVVEAVRIADSAELDLPASVWEAGSVFALQLRSFERCRNLAGRDTVRFATNHPESPKIQLRFSILHIP